MTRLAGLVLAAVGGYLVGRHLDRLQTMLARMLPRQEPSPLPDRVDATEYEHEYEREAAHRHEVAGEIRRRPLRERPAPPDDAEGIASQPIRRERDDHPYPTST